MFECSIFGFVNWTSCVCWIGESCVIEWNRWVLWFSGNVCCCNLMENCFESCNQCLLWNNLFVFNWLNKTLICYCTCELYYLTRSYTNGAALHLHIPRPASRMLPDRSEKRPGLRVVVWTFMREQSLHHQICTSFEAHDVLFTSLWLLCLCAEAFCQSHPTKWWPFNWALIR